MAVKGHVAAAKETGYILKEGTVFSLAKLQPDYKTPGVISDRSEKVTNATTSVDMGYWDATKKLGLTVR